MNRRIRTLAMAVLAVNLAGAALADGTKADAATAKKATEAVTAQGYEVRNVEMQDGMVEVYAVKDGKTAILKLDADYKIVETESGEEADD